MAAGFRFTTAADAARNEGRYWRSRSPEARVSAAEIIRQQMLIWIVRGRAARTPPKRR